MVRQHQGDSKKKYSNKQNYNLFKTRCKHNTKNATNSAHKLQHLVNILRRHRMSGFVSALLPFVLTFILQKSTTLRLHNLLEFRLTG